MENIKQIKLRVPAKASAWYVASSVLARGIGALCTPIFTRLLTPEEYGLFPLYNTWLTVVSVILTLELTGGVIYRGLQKYENKRDDFLSSVFGLFLTIFMTFCTLYFAFSSYFNKISSLSTLITVLMFAEIFANAVIAFYTARARFEYRYKSAVAINLITAFAIPFVSVAIILLTNLRSEARIIASSVTFFLLGIYALTDTLKRSQKLFDKEMWLFLLKFNLPLLPHYLSMSLIIRIGEITIGRSFGTEALGKYSIAVSVGMAMTVITNGILSALSPWILRKVRIKDNAKIRDILLLTTKLISALCLLMLAAAPELMKILTTSAFFSALPAVYPLALSVIPIFLSNALISAEMYFERSVLVALPSIASAALNIMLSLFILPKIDYRFASVFILLSYLLLTVLTTIVFKHLSGEFPLKIKSTLTVFCISLGYTALLFVFRGVILSRIILVLPILPILFITAKQVLLVTKEE